MSWQFTRRWREIQQERPYLKPEDESQLLRNLIVIALDVVELNGSSPYLYDFQHDILVRYASQTNQQAQLKSMRKSGPDQKADMEGLRRLVMDPDLPVSYLILGIQTNGDEVVSFLPRTDTAPAIASDHSARPQRVSDDDHVHLRTGPRGSHEASNTFTAGLGNSDRHDLCPSWYRPLGSPGHSSTHYPPGSSPRTKDGYKDPLPPFMFHRVKGDERLHAVLLQDPNRRILDECFDILTSFYQVYIYIEKPAGKPICGLIGHCSRKLIDEWPQDLRFARFFNVYYRTRAFLGVAAWLQDGYDRGGIRHVSKVLLDEIELPRMRTEVEVMRDRMSDPTPRGLKGRNVIQVSRLPWDSYVDLPLWRCPTQQDVPTRTTDEPWAVQGDATHRVQLAPTADKSPTPSAIEPTTVAVDDVDTIASDLLIDFEPHVQSSVQSPSVGQATFICEQTADLNDTISLHNNEFEPPTNQRVRNEFELIWLGTRAGEFIIGNYAKKHDDYKAVLLAAYGEKVRAGMETAKLLHLLDRVVLQEPREKNHRGEDLLALISWCQMFARTFLLSTSDTPSYKTIVKWTQTQANWARMRQVIWENQQVLSPAQRQVHGH
ncbi:hypothetical protein AB5N19_08271 [Seiridium cardinale]